MSEPQPIRFSVPEAGFDLTLLPEAGRQRGSQAFQEAVTAYYKDAYREAGGRVDVGFSEGQIEVNWEPQSGQLPASASIAAHLEAGRYDEAIPLLRTRAAAGARSRGEPLQPGHGLQRPDAATRSPGIAGPGGAAGSW